MGRGFFFLFSFFYFLCNAGHKKGPFEYCKGPRIQNRKKRWFWIPLSLVSVFFLFSFVLLLYCGSLIVWNKRQRERRKRNSPGSRDVVHSVAIGVGRGIGASKRWFAERRWRRVTFFSSRFFYLLSILFFSFLSFLFIYCLQNRNEGRGGRRPLPSWVRRWSLLLLGTNRSRMGRGLRFEMAEKGKKRRRRSPLFAILNPRILFRF